ncbi:hypothetical protein QBC39DRAFT_344214 [Podospora conica]|nr:hypothetical protein QBC39DRAFT_344214 [Schizothecium conicum]
MYLLENLVSALAINLATPVASNPPSPTRTIIPRPPKLCSDGAFVNNATAASPLVADCLRLTFEHEYSPPWTFEITKDVRYTNTAWYKSCMFGVRSTVGDTKFNREDQHALVLAATKGLKDDDRIQGTAKVNCNGVEVEWSIYEPRDSEWN